MRIGVGLNLTDLDIVRQGAGGGGGPTIAWPAISGIVLAYEQDNAFQDAALTVPAVASGDPVLGLKDLSGNGHHATNAAADHGRRILTAAASGKNAVSFGISNNLLTVASPVTMTDFYLFAVVRWPVITGGSASGFKAVLSDDSNRFLSNHVNDIESLGSVTTQPYPVIPDQWVLLESYRSGTTWQVYLNGLKWGNDVTVAGTSIATKYVGQNHIGSIALLAVLSAAPAGSDLTTIRSYVQKKYHCPGKNSWNQVDGGTVSVPSAWAATLVVRQDGSLYENAWGDTQATGANFHARDAFSSDEGDTWSVPRQWLDQTVDPSYPWGDLDVGAYQRVNGDIVVPIQVGLSGLSTSAGATLLRLWISHDNASTFPTSIDITPASIGGVYGAFIQPYGRMFEVGSRVFLPCYSVRTTGTGQTDVIILKSDDNLATWQLYSVVAQYTTTFTPSETAILRITSSFWLAVMRDDFSPHFYLYQAYSLDGGATWSSPVAIFTEASTNHVSPDLYLLNDGKILLAYGNRPYGHVTRLGAWDGVHTVTWGNPLYLWHYSVFAAGQAGYPSIAQMPSGNLGALFMLTRDNQIEPGLLNFRAFAETDLVVPVQVTGLAATTSAPGVLLNWTANLGLGVTYNVYRGTSTGTETLWISGIQTPWFYEVPGAGTWFYKISASNYMGEGSLSSEVSITFATPPALPYLDTFVDANGTPIASHTMNVGNGWAVLSGTWTIEGNQLSCDAGGDVFCSTETYHSDCTIELDIVFASSVTNYEVAVFARASSNANGIAITATGGALHIYKIINGSFFALSATSIPAPVASTTYRLRAILSGDQISAVWDVLGTPLDIPAVTCDFNQAVTKHGVYCYSGFPTHLFGRWHMTSP